ncbi:MAG: hypothetical protein WDN31_22480 [Hyphomicrobium sp.]
MAKGSDFSVATISPAASGTPADFEINTNLGPSLVGDTLVAQFPPGLPADPTLDISIPQSTMDAADAAGPRSGVDVSKLPLQEAAAPVASTTCQAADTDNPDAPPIGPGAGAPGATQPGEQPSGVSPPRPLALTKTPTGCTDAGVCTFDVTVANTTGEDIPGPIKVGRPGRRRRDAERAQCALELQPRRALYVRAPRTHSRRRLGDDDPELSGKPR